MYSMTVDNWHTNVQLFNLDANELLELKFLPPEGDLLLFKVSSIFFINKNKIEEIPHRELIIDILIGRGKIICF